MENSNRIYPTNPLGIIATFVFFIEAITASSLHFLTGTPILLERVVYFIILFPSAIAFLFFGILIFKREILFAPSDFKNEDNFIKILNKIELGQRITQATLDPPADIESTLTLVEEIISKGEVKNVVRIGRGYVKLKEFSKAKKFFLYVREKTPRSNDFYYKISLNLAYAEIGLGDYQAAFNYLKEVESLKGENDFWYLSSMAYVLNKIGHLDSATTFSEKTKLHTKFVEEKSALKILYPDFFFDN